MIGRRPCEDPLQGRAHPSCIAAAVQDWSKSSCGECCNWNCLGLKGQGRVRFSADISVEVVIDCTAVSRVLVGSRMQMAFGGCCAICLSKCCRRWVDSLGDMLHVITCWGIRL